MKSSKERNLLIIECALHYQSSLISFLGKGYGTNEIHLHMNSEFVIILNYSSGSHNTSFPMPPKLTIFVFNMNTKKLDIPKVFVAQ